MKKIIRLNDGCAIDNGPAINLSHISMIGKNVCTDGFKYYEVVFSNGIALKINLNADTKINLNIWYPKEKLIEEWKSAVEKAKD